MRKSAIILAGAICFDLGVMIVSSQAFGREKLKGTSAVAACLQNGGKVVDEGGEKYCETTNPGAPAVATPAPANR